MKVIFLKDLTKIGRKGEIKDLSDGYVRNFLVPKGIVEILTPGKEKKAEENKNTKEKQQKEKEKNDLLSARKIKEFFLEFKIKTGKQGEIFGVITQKDIAEKLKMENLEIKPEQIQMDRHLKTAGEHSVKIKLSPTVSAELKIKINPEN